MPTHCNRVIFLRQTLLSSHLPPGLQRMHDQQESLGHKSMWAWMKQTILSLNECYPMLVCIVSTKMSLIPLQDCRSRGFRGFEGSEGAMAPPDFGRSVNPISTEREGGRICPAHYYWPHGFLDPPTALLCKVIYKTQMKSLKNLGLLSFIDQFILRR